ncbi:hypothetical protein FDECE_14184 [Fusarium decemcellulare]|nr:hypothetical protein FDECE_14184 [Fusarium decemcellulare]
MQYLFPLLLAVATGAYCQQEHCNATCQLEFEKAFASESQQWVAQDVSLDPFYDVPKNASGAKPGDLLRWQQLTPDEQIQSWNIPKGLSVARFLYLSEDMDGSPLPASAFAVLPANHTRGALDTVVWMHGTAGHMRNCAPTNHKQLYYGETVFGFAQQGYAVIGPDYTGLGTDIPQGFMYESGFLHAADGALGLVAARAAIGAQLSDKWAVVGHSEGGLTAWRTAERLAMPGQEALLAAGQFVGAVSMAPALRPLDLIPESFERANGGPVGDVVSTYLLQSLAGLFPEQIRIQDYLTKLALDRLKLIDRACLETGDALFGNLTKDQTFKDTTWLTHPVVVDWQKRYNGLGPHALAAPMLVVQGGDDPLTYASATEADFNSMCSKFPESSAELLLYTGKDHDGVLEPSTEDVFAWLADRFNNVALPSGCQNRTIHDN